VSAYLYILASKRKGTLYVGVTTNLIKRIYEHKQDLVDGFTRRYQVRRLVYFEEYRDVRDAILREKRMKKWKRQWKIRLIEKSNQQWMDLYEQLVG
jgi:putative endonuclease